MSSKAQRFMGGGRGGKVAVKKSVSRGGKTFQQTFWMSPQEAAALQKTPQKEAAAKTKRLRAVADLPQETPPGFVRVGKGGKSRLIPKRPRVEFKTAKARTDFDKGLKALKIDPVLAKAAFQAPPGYTVQFESAEMEGQRDPYSGKESVTSVMFGGPLFKKGQEGSGDTQGNLWRAFHRENEEGWNAAEGDLVVTHHSISLNKDLRDGGLGTEMILDQLSAYEKMGVSRVDLTAADIGRYLWMKVGFEPSTRTASHVTNYLSNFFDADDSLSLDQEETLLTMAREPGGLVEFARMQGLPEVEYTDYDGETHSAPLNKAALLDAKMPAWQGSIHADRPHWGEAKEILQGYLEKKQHRAAEDKNDG